ncbi:MAG: sigma-70 family RNA polymerase sigma factor [Bacteroidetes bacterium]|nr:sigma-70 family RNA polymerase sigma factor [Bacteroidota bacterium]MBL6943065.1 sigma-70 family RNA polymerase sigma factor [Bacteroidales bacterium]
MLQYKTQELLNGILENNRIIVQHIYDRNFQSIRKFIEKFGGSKDDALDVFQDGIIVIYEQLKSGDVKQINNFQGYLFSICKFKWFNILRDGKFSEITNIELEDILPSDEYEQISERWGEVMIKEERVKVYFNCFMELTSKCQQMIRYVAHGLDIEDIATEMNFSSVTYTYRKRQLCLNKLIELVKQRLNQINGISYDTK